jgi:hypothetical protein
VDLQILEVRVLVESIVPQSLTPNQPAQVVLLIAHCVHLLLVPQHLRACHHFDLLLAQVTRLSRARFMLITAPFRGLTVHTNLYFAATVRMNNGVNARVSTEIENWHSRLSLHGVLPVLLLKLIPLPEPIAMDHSLPFVTEYHEPSAHQILNS